MQIIQTIEQLQRMLWVIKVAVVFEFKMCFGRNACITQTHAQKNIKTIIQTVISYINYIRSLAQRHIP